MKPLAQWAMEDPDVVDFMTSGVNTQNESSREVYLVKLGSMRLRAEGLGIKKPFLQMTKPELQQVINDVRKMKSGKQYLDVLRSFFIYHQRQDSAAASTFLKVVPKLKNNKTKVGPKDIFEVDELNALLETAKSLRDRVLLVTLYETGGRISEALSINLEGLKRHENGGNNHKPWYKAWFGKMKEEGTEHFAYIFDPASVAIIDEWLASYPGDVKARPRPLVPSFSNRHTDSYRLSPGGANEVLQKMADAAGITKPIHAHLFRHTRITHLLRQGKSDTIVKKAVGLVPESKMLARYAHLVSADVEAAFGLTDSEEKPAELLVPTKKVPAMTELAFQKSPQTKALEQMKEELLAEQRNSIAEMMKLVQSGKFVVSADREGKGMVIAPKSAQEAYEQNKAQVDATIEDRKEAIRQKVKG